MWIDDTLPCENAEYSWQRADFEWVSLATVRGWQAGSTGTPPKLLHEIHPW